jgi:hypothetical protein
LLLPTAEPVTIPERPPRLRMSIFNALTPCYAVNVEFLEDVGTLFTNRRFRSRSGLVGRAEADERGLYDGLGSHPRASVPSTFRPTI